MKPDFSNISLRALLHDTVLHVALLSQNATVPPTHFWRARCAGLVAQLEQSLQDAQCDDAIVQEISLAQCVLLDEVTLRYLPAERRHEWLRELLQTRFYATNSGKEEIRLRVEALFDEIAPDPQLLDWYGVMLAFGVLDEQAKQNWHRRCLIAKLEREKNIDPSIPAYEWIEVASDKLAYPAKLSWHRSLVWVISGIALGALLWLGCDVYLRQAVDIFATSAPASLLGSLGALHL